MTLPVWASAARKDPMAHALSVTTADRFSLLNYTFPDRQGWVRLQNALKPQDAKAQQDLWHLNPSTASNISVKPPYLAYEK